MSLVAASAFPPELAEPVVAAELGAAVVALALAALVVLLLELPQAARAAVAPKAAVTPRTFLRPRVPGRDSSVAEPAPSLTLSLKVELVILARYPITPDPSLCSRCELAEHVPFRAGGSAA
jgi:hypothetical protein